MANSKGTNHGDMDAWRLCVIMVGFKHMIIVHIHENACETEKTFFLDRVQNLRSLPMIILKSVIKRV